MWPGCGFSVALISDDGGDTFWCPHHLLDSDLPDPVAGVSGVCESCGVGCATYLVGVSNLDEVCLHAGCRRAWTTRERRKGLVGAYARRQKGGQ